MLQFGMNSLIYFIFVNIEIKSLDELPPIDQSLHSIFAVIEQEI